MDIFQEAERLHGAVRLVGDWTTKLRWVAHGHTRVAHAIESIHTHEHTGRDYAIAFCREKVYSLDPLPPHVKYDCGRCIRSIKAHAKQLAKRGVVRLG